MVSIYNIKKYVITAKFPKYVPKNYEEGNCRNIAECITLKSKLINNCKEEKKKSDFFQKT